MPPLRLGAVLKCYARGLRRFSDAVATSREGPPLAKIRPGRPASGVVTWVKAVEPPFQAEIVPFRLAKDLPNRNRLQGQGRRPAVADHLLCCSPATGHNKSRMSLTSHIRDPIP
jgi:hypothetical protein